jgi:hypothetical protein
MTQVLVLHLPEILQLVSKEVMETIFSAHKVKML